MGCVYLLRFASGKSYVGVTTARLTKRLNQHRSAAARNSRGCRMVTRAWRKHGAPTVLTLLESDDLQALKECEQRMVAELDTISPRGYNITPGGDVVTPEMVAKRIATRKANGGHVITESMRVKISATLKARSAELRPARIGRTYSAASRAKMAASQRAYALTPEGLARSERLAEAKRGTKQTDATKAKRAASRSGYRHSVETIERIRAAHKARHGSAT